MIPIIVKSQDHNNQRIKTILIKDSIIKIDSFSIIPGSFFVYNKDSIIINNNKYEINEIDAKIKISDELLFGENIVCKYNVYPVMLSKVYYNRSLQNIEPEDLNKSYWRSNNNKTSFKDIGSLSKEGSISRKIMIGNNQDVSVLSNIDLRLSGKLKNNINIQAVISDNNLPFQEDGNSYKLQELDKIYIRVFNNNINIITGDIAISHNGRFLKYQKKSTGIFINTKKKEKLWAYESSSSLSLNKGEYAINRFNGEEGNQGPYKLIGNKGESFIIVLSGTEKIFIDGNRLKRGIENDYTINYNTGEITFTNNQLITKDKRIHIEFEYSNRNYTQSVFSTNHNIKKKKSNFNVSIFSQKDWKDLRISETLSEEEKSTLSLSGDAKDNMFVSSIDSTGFMQEMIMYKKIDTIIEDVNITFYKMSNNIDSGIYQIQFTYVGENEGNYILDENGINGRYYKWIRPIITNGEIIPQGDFDPKKQLVSPKMKTLISTIFDYNISEKSSITSEIVYSYIDDNLFSNIDEENNSSIASYFNINYRIFRYKSWETYNNSSIKYISENYSGIDRYRNVEHERIWGTEEIGTQKELMISNTTLIKKNNETISNYTLSILKKGTEYQGSQHNIKINLSNNNTSVYNDLEITNTSSEKFKKYLLKNNINFLQEFKPFKLDIMYNQEKRYFYNDNRYHANSLSFNELKSEIKNSSNNIKLRFSIREERKIHDSLFYDFSKSYETTGSIKIIKNNLIDYNLFITRRNLNYFADTLENETSILSKNMISMNILRNFLKINSSYQIGKGKEPKKEQSFIQVPDGLGTHKWIDNNNNNIQELSEFSHSIFQDEANYVMLILPSKEHENVYNLEYSHNITTNSRKMFSNKIFKKFDASSHFKIHNKNTDLNSLFNPYNKEYIDNSISYRSTYDNSIYFNRSNPKINLMFSKRNTMSKNLLSYGTDMKETKENILVCNTLINNAIINSIKINFGNKKNESNTFNSKNYMYYFQNISEKITISHNKYKITTEYISKIKKTNNLNENKVSLNEIKLESSYNANEKTNFKLTNRFINIKSEEENNSILSYELLEGLSVGNNFLLELDYKKQLKNNMVIVIGYNARKSKDSMLKHVGNMQIQYYF